MRLRPHRSPSTPKLKSRPANTSVYELIAHSSWLCVAPRPCSGSASVRMATFSTVLSSTTTSRLTTSTDRIAQRRGWPVFPGICGGFATAESVEVDTMDPPKTEVGTQYQYETVPYLCLGAYARP